MKSDVRIKKPLSLIEISTSADYNYYGIITVIPIKRAGLTDIHPP